MLLAFRLRSAFSAASTLLAAGCGGAVGTTSATGSPAPAASASPSDPGAQPAPSGGTGQGTATPTNARCSTAARTLATAAGTPGAIALDPAGIVFTVADHRQATATLSRVDPTSGATTVVASGTWVSLVGVDRGTVVWTSGTDEHLYAAPIKGGPTADLGVRLADYEGSYGRSLLGVAGGFVVWADGKTGMSSFYSLPVSGGAIAHHALAAGGPSPESWVAFEGSLFWATSNALWMGALPDGASARQVAPADAGTSILGYRNGTVYVTISGGVGAVAVSDGTMRPLNFLWKWPPPSTACATPGKNGADAFLVGPDEAVYQTAWTDCMNGQFAYSVQRARAGESKPTDLAAFIAAGQLQEGIPKAVDDACLYWIESNGTTATLKTIAQ